MASTTGVGALKSLSKMQGPKGIPFIRTALSLSGSSTRHIDRRHKQYGPVFKDSVGPVNAIFVSDPNIMRKVLTKLEGRYPIHVLPESWIIYNEIYKRKRGLLFMDGEEWLQTRRSMNNIILKPNTETWIETPISLAVNDLIANWKEKCSRSGFSPNLDKELYRFSLNVMLSVMLGSSYASSARQFDALLESFSQRVHQIFMYSSQMYHLPAKFYSTLKLAPWKGFVHAVHETLFYGQKMIDQIYKLDDIGDGLIARMIAEKIGKEDITRIIIDFIIAAGDTTAFTTQWALYNLSKNPEVFQNLQSTLDNNEEAQSQIKGILKETMRLYPAAAFITRVTTAEGELDGYEIPAGTVIVLSMYTAGRDPSNFPRPLEFSPKRWDKDEKNNFQEVLCPHATMPFAMGARSCVGRKVAMVQMKETISQITKNFNMKSLNEKPVEDVMQMIIKPKDPIQILLTPRKLTT